MGIVSQRRKQQRRQRAARRLTVVLIVVLLGFAAMSAGLRDKLGGMARRGMAAVQAFAAGENARAELTLPEREIYALQLAVFDSGERAASEAERLQQDGIRCMVWQREKMRVVSRVALDKAALDVSVPGGQKGYVISETLPRVAMRLTADARSVADAQALIMLPDALLLDLLAGDRELGAVVSDTRAQAQAALAAHPENVLYAQLAQSLVNWCGLIDAVQREDGAQDARSYAALTMCTLCRELRAAIPGS